MDLLSELKKNPFVLAPMAGITDLPFRSFMREMGCGVVITELVSATGLKFNSERTLALMRFEDLQHPVGVQLFGEETEHLAFAARKVEELGADFVDLNFGCPVPKVVKKGAGAAMLKDVLAVRNVFRAVKSAVNIPVTVKMRSGWDESSKNADQVAQIAYDEGLTWVAIHGRTRAAGYSGQADWNYIAEVKAKSPIPILGNGDILTAEQALNRLVETRCDGVMIGRGCLKNPWIFQQCLSLLKNEDGVADKNFPWLFQKLRRHLDNHCDERLASLHLKKLASWYSSGYPGASQLRKDVFRAQSRVELDKIIDDFFADKSNTRPQDTSHEPFLMGGHG